MKLIGMVPAEAKDLPPGTVLAFLDPEGAGCIQYVGGSSEDAIFFWHESADLGDPRMVAAKAVLKLRELADGLEARYPPDATGDEVLKA